MPTTAQRRAQLDAERQVQAISVAQRDAEYRREIAGVLARPLTREALLVSLAPLIGGYVRWAFKAGRETAELDAQTQQ